VYSPFVVHPMELVRLLSKDGVLDQVPELAWLNFVLSPAWTFN
jgi:hypothetical protein